METNIFEPQSAAGAADMNLFGLMPYAGLPAANQERIQ